MQPTTCLSSLGPERAPFSASTDRLRNIRTAGCDLPEQPVGQSPHRRDRLPGSRGGEASIDRNIDGLPAEILKAQGLDIRAYRAGPLERRLPACLRALGVTDPGEARPILNRRPDRLPMALDALLLGVTEFFRDPLVFQGLSDRMPLEFGKARPPRVWSVGCSSGCELYSVAMLLAELGLLQNSRLRGTDCRPLAIAAAEQAAYPESLLRQIPTELRRRYLEPEDSRWRVVAPLRAQASWQVEDVCSRREQSDAGEWDLILWRNTAIYLKPQAAQVVWRRLTQSLRPGGLLVTGKGERPDRALPLVPVQRCVYRRVS